MLSLMVPLYVLFEGSILLAALLGSSRERSAPTPSRTTSRRLIECSSTSEAPAGAGS